MFEADHLICAIPFPPLRRVEIRPAFSAAKRKAIAELAYDSVTRVILQCRTRFWEKEKANGFGISDLPQEIWHPTFDQPGPRGLLASYMFSGVARRTGAMARLDAGRVAIGVAGGTGGERGQVKLPRRDGPTAELVARVIPSHNRDGGWLDQALEGLRRAQEKCLTGRL